MIKHKSVYFFDLRLCVAVDAAVCAVFAVCESEDMLDILLSCRDASRILALQNVNELFGKLDVLLVNNNTVANDRNRDITADEAELCVVDVDIAVDLDDILLTHLAARYVLEDRNRTVKLIKGEEIINLHRASCVDVVDYNAVFYRINVHNYTSNNLRISAIRANLPFFACLK